MKTIILIALALLAIPFANAAQPPKAQTAAIKTLLDVGTADAVFLVTIRAGVITVEQVKIQTVGTGPVVPPDDPPPVIPPATDAAKAFADAIAKVKEADKVKTAAMLKSMVDPILAASTKPDFKLEDTKANFPMLLGFVTMAKPDWSDFSTVMKTRVEATKTVAELTTVLKAASDELAKVK